MVYDDPMGEDHHEQWESPKHRRRKYEVCELLELENFIHINFALEKKHGFVCITAVGGGPTIFILVYVADPDELSS